jgi:hypothetical protein
MAKKRNRGKQYQLPPHIVRANQQSALWSWKRSKPTPPPVRTLLILAVGSPIALAMALFLWIPADSLAQDLGSSGVTANAVVTEVNSRQKLVKIRFTQGRDSGLVAKLSDYGGVLPDVRTGTPLSVTYDPSDPNRSLPSEWVINPPTILVAYFMSAVAALMMISAAIGAIRRRRMLRTWGAQQPGEPRAEAVTLTKPQP